MSALVPEEVFSSLALVHFTEVATLGFLKNKPSYDKLLRRYEKNVDRFVDNMALSSYPLKKQALGDDKNVLSEIKSAILRACVEYCESVLGVRSSLLKLTGSDELEDFDLLNRESFIEYMRPIFDGNEDSLKPRVMAIYKDFAKNKRDPLMEVLNYHFEVPSDTIHQMEPKNNGRKYDDFECSNFQKRMILVSGLGVA